MRKESLVLLAAVVVVQFLGASASPIFDLANTLQALESMGLPRTSSSDITVGKGKRRGDSPIYYIKLPPMPYFYANNHAPVAPVVPSFPSRPNSFHQVDVDFTNNGRPEQIYHWNYKPKVPIQQKPLHTPSFHSTDALYTNLHRNNNNNNVDSIIRNSIVLPPGIPVMTKSVPVKPVKKPIMNNVKNPFISLNRDFIYNGKPSGLYVWKPRPKISTHKYKHHYFKHFNY